VDPLRMCQRRQLALPVARHPRVASIFYKESTIHEALGAVSTARVRAAPRRLLRQVASQLDRPVFAVW